MQVTRLGPRCSLAELGTFSQPSLHYAPCLCGQSHSENSSPLSEGGPRPRDTNHLSFRRPSPRVSDAPRLLFLSRSQPSAKSVPGLPAGAAFSQRISSSGLPNHPSLLTGFLLSVMCSSTFQMALREPCSCVNCADISCAHVLCLILEWRLPKTGKSNVNLLSFPV